MACLSGGPAVNIPTYLPTKNPILLMRQDLPCTLWLLSKRKRVSSVPLVLALTPLWLPVTCLVLGILVEADKVMTLRLSICSFAAQPVVQLSLRKCAPLGFTLSIF